MGFSVKELFYSLQGEGMFAGRSAVFCRFSGCNLWNGREENRATAACPFCDTDFIGTNGLGGGYFATENALVEAILCAMPQHLTVPAPHYKPMVILTGGEPALQVTRALIDALHAKRFVIAIETNGSLTLPDGLDWITVSPKAGVPLLVHKGHELKLVWPQTGLDPTVFLSMDFKHFILQPCDNATRLSNLQVCLAYCLGNPAWRLGLQVHKILDIQ